MSTRILHLSRTPFHCAAGQCSISSPAYLPPALSFGLTSCFASSGALRLRRTGPRRQPRLQLRGAPSPMPTGSGLRLFFRVVAISSRPVAVDGIAAKGLLFQREPGRCAQGEACERSTTPARQLVTPRLRSRPPSNPCPARLPTAQKLPPKLGPTGIRPGWAESSQGVCQ